VVVEHDVGLASCKHPIAIVAAYALRQVQGEPMVARPRLLAGPTLDARAEMPELLVAQALPMIVAQGSAGLPLPRCELVQILTPVLPDDADPVSSFAAPDEPIEVADEPGECEPRADYHRHQAGGDEASPPATRFDERVARMSRQEG